MSAIGLSACFAGAGLTGAVCPACFAGAGLPDSGQDYSVLSESSGCGSAVCNSGSAVEAGINNFTDLIIQDMCELAAGSACASASAAAAPAAQSAPAQLWAC